MHKTHTNTHVAAPPKAAKRRNIYLYPQVAMCNNKMVRYGAVVTYPEYSNQIVSTLVIMKIFILVKYMKTDYEKIMIKYTR